MGDDSFEKLGFLLVGWLLGLLAPLIVDFMRKQRDDSLGRAAILTELNDVACVLATAAYGSRMRLGKVDREFLEWLKATLEQHAVAPRLTDFVPTLRKHLSFSDEEIKAMALYGTADEGTGTMLQKYSLPLLDSRVSALWSFDNEFQRKLLEIRRSVSLLDDIVDRSRKYFDLTFSKLEDDNSKIVRSNLNEAYGHYATRAEVIVNLIRDLKRHRV